MKRTLLSLLAVANIATLGTVVTMAHAAAPLSGIEFKHIDTSVRPQDDFAAYMTGKWMSSTAIPPDRSRWGTFDQVREAIQPQLRTLIEAAQKEGAKQGSEAQKIGDLYASFMNEARLEQLGYRSLAGELARIRALRDKNAIPALIAHLARIGVDTPYSVTVGQDSGDATSYAAHVRQAGLGLPDRDYYLKQDDARLAAVRAGYQQHVARMLGMTGAAAAQADASAAAIVALETALAQAQWTRVENRDPVRRYNKADMAQLAAMTPGYDWKGALAAAGVASKVDHVIVAQPSYLAGFGKVLAATSLATWKAYFEWQLVRAYAPYLSQDFVAADFAFYGTALTGVTENRPRWKRAVGAVDTMLGEAIGKRYVAAHFPAERRARMETLVQNLMTAYKGSIDTLDWMGPETRQQAQAKLAKFRPKIGYPDRWRDYTALSISRDDLVGNVMRARSFAYNRNIGKLGKPVDRSEWTMTPQTVNAYYSPTMNEIVFPASILQPPFFDMRADDAVNYGAIGAAIGHEIGHGFDDQGSQSDGDGNLRNWWTEQDRARFQARADMLIRQFDGYTALPGYQVNGALTLGENIGDNTGLAIAYKAYQLSLGGTAAPVIDGLTGDQRFFMGFAQIWRGKVREQQQIVQIKTDPHAPGQFRTNGSVRNHDAFYEAFGVKPGDKLYLPPQQRVRIW